MKMDGVRDPFSKALICSIVDPDEVRRFPPALLCKDNATFDPVVDDPQADAVSRTNLAYSKRSGGMRWYGNTMLKANPTYHVDGERSVSCARKPFIVEPYDDLFIVVSWRQVADFCNECFGVADCVGAVRLLPN